MRKYFSLLCLLLLLFITGCVEPSEQKDKLGSVVLQYNDTVLTWDEVENAEYYEIYVNNHLYETTKELSVNLNKLNNGKYTIYVVACDDNKQYLNCLPTSIDILVDQIIDNKPEEDDPVIDDKPVDNGNGAREIEFFMINDTHGAFFDGEYSGMTRLSSYFNKGLLLKFDGIVCCKYFLFSYRC